MKILVTGGAGFIGSNVVDAYIEAGHEVTVLDNLFTGKRENLNPKARFCHLDIRSEGLKEVFLSVRPDVVNHHAAQMSVPASVEDPIFNADVNVKGLLNVLEVSRISGVKKVIFISSGGAVYGEAGEYPTGEACVPEPLSPYAITKFIAEKYLNFYSLQWGLDYTVLRYANIYGPRQVPHGEAGVMAIFMDNLLAGRPSAVYRYPGEERGMTRDYCFVADAARANILALEKGSREAFNIGTGVATYTEGLFKIIYDTVKKKAPDLQASLSRPIKKDARAGDLKRSCLNVDKAHGVLNWQPETELRKGIELTLEWRLRKAGK
ncbi:MAG: NAD-dependent epimerase/dehydratase family protein [Deltaproteobacteria bacterium]|nr:NAD-dependent epimerase/dehydratase family protein [Deltaproteobacteria bacterium]MBI5810969.1 NAD-dependent epimerase/dehydratase family protein [Deltaproteobacteria bacterium]